jgi:hypothetical protein
MTSPKRIIAEVNMIVSWSKGFLFNFLISQNLEKFSKRIEKKAEFIVEKTHFPKNRENPTKICRQKNHQFHHQKL